jgi:hypothetical protein
MFENGSPKGSDYECTLCAFKCSAKSKYTIHLSTAKHRKMTQKEEIFEQNDGGIFECIACKYTCKYKAHYDRHMLTEKHMDKVNSNALFEKEAFRLPLAEKEAEKEAEPLTPYMCKCGKTYASRSSLWYHKKRCQIDIDFPEEPEKVNRVFPVSHTFTVEPEDTSMETVLFTLLKEQTERSNKLEEQAYKMEERHAEQMAAHAEAAAEQNRLMLEAISLNGPQCITNNNTTNNQFNLNVFLNEDCKDAFTLKEVADSIECTVSDLDRMDTDGYAATITRKILESIQHMSITERPIHCTDARRNTVCVKSEEGWERNEAAMKCLNNTVYWVGNKLGRIVSDWRVAYPDHFRGSDSRREQYHRLVMDVTDVRDRDVEARIASKICKGVILDRKVAMM